MFLVLIDFKVPGWPSESNVNHREEKSWPLSQAEAMLVSTAVFSTEIQKSHLHITKKQNIFQDDIN